MSLSHPGTSIHASSIHVIFQIHLLRCNTPVLHSLSFPVTQWHTQKHTQCQDGGQVMVLRDETSIENNYSWGLAAPWPLQYKKLLLVRLAHVWPTSCPVCLRWWRQLLWLMKILFITADNLTIELTLAALLQWLPLLRFIIYLLCICLALPCENFTVVKWK